MPKVTQLKVVKVQYKQTQPGSRVHTANHKPKLSIRGGNEQAKPKATWRFQMKLDFRGSLLSNEESVSFTPQANAGRL